MQDQSIRDFFDQYASRIALYNRMVENMLHASSREIWQQAIHHAAARIKSPIRYRGKIAAYNSAVAPKAIQPALRPFSCFLSCFFFATMLFQLPLSAVSSVMQYTPAVALAPRLLAERLQMPLKRRIQSASSTL